MFVNIIRTSIKMPRRRRTSRKDFEKVVGSRAEVFHGTAHHTSGGLKKKDLKKNKRGEIVSIKMSERAKKMYRKNSALKAQAKKMKKKWSKKKQSKKRKSSKKRKRSSKKKKSKK